MIKLLAILLMFFGTSIIALTFVEKHHGLIYKHRKTLAKTFLYGSVGLITLIFFVALSA